MFKRGDILTGKANGNLYLYRGEDVAGFDITQQRDTVVTESGTYEPYSGPTYEKGDQRFVPSGEYRVPNKDECWLCGLEGNLVITIAPFSNKLRDGGYRPILLPIPELEPEHEFAVGDWVKINDDNPNFSQLPAGIYRVDGVMGEGSIGIDGYAVSPKFLTLLPGRPLTTDDLMQVLSGKKITVECHAECCVKGKGHPVSGGIIYNIFKHTTYFFHANQFHQVLPSAALAGFEDGSIGFSDSVEGNIFVVEG